MIELPLDRAYHWEKTLPNEVFLTQPTAGIARDWTWAQTMDEARRMANFLMSRNWPAGSHIVIYSKNCAWWIMAELAIWMSGHVTVPIYPSLTPESARQLFEHCDPVACFIGPLDSTDFTQQTTPSGVFQIRFPNTTMLHPTSSWEEITKSTLPLTTNPQRAAEEIATIIYTSGTTGSPKGAIHRFLTFPYLAKAIAQVAGEGRQRQISYLPLAHIAERGLSETPAIYYSWRLYFSENTATFLTDLKRAKPTVFFSVPRLYAKFQQKVFEKISQRTLSGLQRLPIVKTLVGHYILKSMGFGQVAFAASGSAALSEDLLLWFRSLRLPLTEGYGTTETGITHTSPNGESRPGYTGKSTPGVECKLSGNGELLLRSPMNMVGYYKNTEDTNRVFTEDGFLRTGDLAEITADGWLRITGRIKEQFKTAKGKYVAPAKIEALLSTHPAIENCLVFGSDRQAPCAVAVLTNEAQRQAATMTGRKELDESFQTLLASVNRRVEVHEHLVFLALVNDRWSIDQGLITPTLKLKRLPLEEYYAPSIEKWLRQNEPIVWALSNSASS